MRCALIHNTLLSTSFVSHHHRVGTAEIHGDQHNLISAVSQNKLNLPLSRLSLRPPGAGARFVPGAVGGTSNMDPVDLPPLFARTSGMSSVAVRENLSCLFGQECRMLRAPEAELKICQHCSRSFHHVCAAENRGSDD
eukprot:751856-Hanusia_phi.AAC.9